MNFLLLFGITNLLPFLPFLVIIWIFLVPPFYKKGENQYLFLEESDKKENFLIIIYNFQSVYMGKGKSSEKHRYRIKKINLQTGKTVYAQKLFSFWASFLAGGIQILGLSANYIYFNVNGKDMQIFDLRNGTKVTDKGQLLRANPEVVDFLMEDMSINPSSGLLQGFNVQGNRIEINPEKKLILTVSEKAISTTLNYQDVYESLPYFEEGNSFSRFQRVKDEGKEFNLNWEPVDDGKRVRLKLETMITMREFGKKDDAAKIIHPEKLASFINPIILGKYNNAAYLKKPYRFLVQHQAFLEKNNSLENYNLSMVTAASEALWQQRQTNLIPKSLHHSKEHKLYVLMGKKLTWLFYADSRATKISVTGIATDSGIVEREPLLIENSWWEKKANS